uniref:Uncharacterized protein n=1 Tax=Anguilla anguilla TaxID=7936 RepID=A0A0E9UPU3_ANGAN
MHGPSSTKSALHSQTDKMHLSLKKASPAACRSYMVSFWEHFLFLSLPSHYCLRFSCC